MEKVVKHIGDISGPVLIFGGIYSNLQALEAIRKISEEHNIDPHNIINTGDIIAYCAHPKECVDQVKNWGVHSIAGNVELNLLDKADDCGCNFDEGSRCDIFSKQWYPYAQAKTGKKHLDYLSTLPQFITFNYAGKKALVLHGTVENTSGYIFKSTPWAEKKSIFENEGVDLIIGGHSGLPFIDRQEGKIWINSGVIGMPANDGKPHTWYAIMANKNDEINVSFHKLDYNNTLASMHMKTNKLPASYAQTLIDGIWDNCDILPPIETKNQGKKIVIDEAVLGESD